MAGVFVGTTAQARWHRPDYSAQDDTAQAGPAQDCPTFLPVFDGSSWGRRPTLAGLCSPCFSTVPAVLSVPLHSSATSARFANSAGRARRLQQALSRRWAVLRWPLPALLAWGLAWAVWALALAAHLPTVAAFVLAAAAGLVLAWPCEGGWRRALVVMGFPLSAWALGATSGLPAWGWLLMLLPLLAAYPLRAWQDAPFFPTPADALVGLDKLLPAPQRVLDAGCGLGHGLEALQKVWPQAALHGIECSAPLAWGAALRCALQKTNVKVQRADLWAASWADFDVVYVFQRPESMARVFAKAAQELRPGAHLVSLEFEVPGQRPVARLQGPGRKPLWLYRPAGAAASRAHHSTQAVHCR
jgi:hypothetical protein